MPEHTWGGKVFQYLMKTEGFRGDVYKDTNGNDTIGYGHKVLPGEDWEHGISESQGRQLLAKDYAMHDRLARGGVGKEVFDAMGEREQAMLTLSAWNPGWGSQPKLVDGIVSGNLEQQFNEHRIHAGNDPMTTRNDDYATLFFPGHERGMELDTSNHETRVVEKKPSTLKTFTDSEAFQLMTEEDQVAALAERDGRFAALLEEDPEEALKFAVAVSAAGRGVEGFTPTVMSSIEGGLERGIGWAARVPAGAIRVAEAAGVIETDLNDDLLDWAHQRVEEGGLRIGTSWQHQIAGILGSVSTGVVPAITLTAAAYPLAAAAGLSGVPLYIVAEGAGLGAAGFLAEFGETGSFDDAAERGAIDTALGGFGGLTSILPRRYRAPLDFAAGLGAGGLEGLPATENVVQALSMVLLANIPGARPSMAKQRAMDFSTETMPHAREVEVQGTREDAARVSSREAMEVALPEPIVSRDGVEYHTMVDALRADGDASMALPETHWNPMDRTDEMISRSTNREALAAEDVRALDFLTGGTPDAEIPKGWNPGWRHVEQVPYGATPDRVTSAAGSKVKRPGEIIGPFAKAFEFNVTRGNVRKAKETGGNVLGWHWARNREMKTLRRDDLQTLAHEWGHDIVVLEPALSRHVQGKELGEDVGRLRGWLQEQELAAGRTFDEKGVPSATLFQHRENVPDDLKYIEELVAMSYDRPNLREGFSEFVRVYLTNNKTFGGQTQMTGSNGAAPKLTEIFENWIDALPKAKQKALKAFAEDSHAYVTQDATTSMLARFGQDLTPEMVMQSTLSKMRQGMIDSNEGAWNAMARSAGPAEADRALGYLQSAQAAGRLTDLAATRSVPRLEIDTDGNPVQKMGNSESLQNILNDIGPTHEMQNAQGAYTAARRQKELYGQADIGGRHVVVRDFVDERVALAKARLAKAGTKSEADIELVRIANTEPRPKLEAYVLDRVGGQRRERTDIGLIDSNLELVSNPRYAHLEGTHERLKGWQREVRNYGQDAGLISQKQADTMDEWNTEYVFPFKRDMSDVIGGGQGGGSSTRGGMVRQLTGSERGFEKDWLSLTLEGADEIFRRAEANLAKKFVVDAIVNSPQAGLWFHMNEFVGQSRSKPHESLARIVGNVPEGPQHRITVWRDGDPFHYAPKDEGLLNSMDFLHPPSRNVAMKIVNRARVMSQDFTTLNPAFFIPALSRDIVGAAVFSKTKGNVFGKAINGAWHAWRNSPEYQNYVAQVGTAASLTNTKAVNPASLLAEARRADSRVQQIIQSPGMLVDTLRRMTNTIEASTRMGEYLAATKQGVPAKHAAWLGTQVQPHFSARGTNVMMRGAMDSVRFLGATLQSVDRLARGLFRDTEGRARLIQRLGGMTLAAIALEETNRMLIDKYDEIPAWLKQSYHLIPFPEIVDGKVKIDIRLLPKNHEVGLVQNVATRVIDEMYADSRKGVAQAAADVTAILLGGVGVNAAGDSFPMPMPVLLGESMELMFNTNFFTGNPIESMEVANNSAFNRVTVDTPQLYKDWGKVTEKAPWLPDFIESPAQAQHLIEAFTSHFGSQAAQLYDFTFNPNRVALLPGEGPISRRFDLAEDRYSTVERDFYDHAKELKELSNDMKAFEDRQEWDRLQAAAEDPVKLQAYQKSKVYDQVRREVAKLDALREQLLLDPRLTPEQRAIQNRDLKIEKRNILRSVLEQWGPE